MKIPSYSEWSQRQSNINPFWWSVKEEKRLQLYQAEYPNQQGEQVDFLKNVFGFKD